MNKYSIDFRIFQLQYLSVYLIVMLPDWLQGTNMYTLYSSYGVNVGTLFLTGFMSSAVFGTFLGIRVDTWGRKFGCIVFCILKVIINLIEHIPSMPALLFGRILGGLFIVYCIWVLDGSEHRKRGFDETLLSSTFSISSWGNGFVAIFAGFLAQYSSGKYFICDPFDWYITCRYFWWYRTFPGDLYHLNISSIENIITGGYSSYSGCFVFNISMEGELRLSW